jgi:rhodanese-related sulfurtransferase
MKRIQLITICLFSLLFLSKPLHAQVKLVQPKEFATQLRGEKSKHLLIDVRTPSEYKKGHLKGAILMNIFDDNFDADLTKLDRNTTYYIYCGIGGRSAECTEKMQTMGFKKVIELDGGIKRWMANGLPVEQ